MLHRIPLGGQKPNNKYKLVVYNPVLCYNTLNYENLNDMMG